MERTIGGIDATRGKLGRDDRAQKGRSAREYDANPRSRRVNRSLRASAAFAAFAADVRDDLNPRGPLQRLMADHVALSAWKLKATLGRLADRDDAAGGDEPAPKRAAPNAADRAARSVREAVESYDFLRSRPAPPIATPNPPVEIEPNEWPILPDGEMLARIEEVEAEGSDDAWRDRLVFDLDVSDTSPIVKGTWITVGHVVSEIVDGSTWADILRTHPELTEEDIRACLAYAIAEEN